MEFISSDTNIWIDFNCIQRLRLPFLLPYTYIMYYEQIEKELQSVNKDELIANGLQSVDITIDEFFLAEEYANKYLSLSKWDRISLAIAKIRNIKLLTGDMSLRKAATKENIQVVGTIGIIDQVYTQELINEQEYIYCLEELIRQNGRVIRLPRLELERRLVEVKNKDY